MTRTHLATILIASIAGAAAGALTTTLWPKATLDSPVAAASQDGVLAKLVKDNAQFERILAEVRDAQALLASNAERSAVRAGDSVAIDASTAPAPAVGTPTEVESPVQPELTLESALAQLYDPEADYDSRTAVFEKVAKAGLLDALVDAMKERADREPNNPDLRVHLGNAYIQKIFAANPAAAGIWASKADSAFDAALELDPQHWEARFTKAIALTHWPAFTGGPSKAITQFETLIGQQDLGPKKDQHAETYVYLGNLYQEKGLTAKAIETWQKGAALFPDNDDLKEKLASGQNH